MAFKPTQRNRDLGAALKKARKAARLKQEVVAERLGTSQATVSRYEAGLCELAPRDRKTLLELCRPEPALRAEIERLAVVTDADCAEDVSPNRDFMLMQEAEKDVIEIRTSSGESIPRELQSDQYTLLQYQKAGRLVSETQLLRDKRERELLLSRSDPPRYHQLLSESSLYRVPGGNPELVREQASHLLDLVEHYPQLSVRVIRFDADLAHFDNMTLLKFADRRRSMVYLPNSTYGRLIRQPRIVADRTRYWEIMRQAAASEENTKKFLHDLARNGRSL